LQPISKIMSKKNEYIIPFVGLKLGTHHFDFEVTDKFFEGFEYSEIEKGNISVSLDFNKSETMLVLNFSISGHVIVACDRCLEDMQTKISGDFRQILKFSNEVVEEDDEELSYIPTGEYEIDVKQYIFDFIMLSVPTRNTHPEGKCNPEVVKKLAEYLVTEEPKPTEKTSEDEEIDPRWAALKSFRKN
jgi:uncharacterized metal-binding protein YceD (DUF177 family)